MSTYPQKTGTIHSYRVARIIDGKSRGVIRVDVSDESDARLVAARYRDHYGVDYRAIGVDREGYSVWIAEPDQTARGELVI